MNKIGGGGGGGGDAEEKLSPGEKARGFRTPRPP
jgi:hypothetical protein